MDETDDKQVLSSDAAGSVRRVDGRRRRRKYTEEVWAQAEPEYLAGATAREISAKYGMSLQTIYLRMGGRGKQARAKEERTNAPAAPEPRQLTEEEAIGFVRAIIAEACEGAAEKLRGKPVKTQTRQLASGKIQTRVSHPAETWAKVRRDYEAGGFTVPVIAERYGIKDATIKKRASNGKWSKIVRKEVLPLKPEDDPQQVVSEGGEAKSGWLTIAHPAQLPPEGNWKTWLFQGGRGAGKTRAGAEWLADLAERTPHGIFALVAPTEHDVREVMIGGPSGLLNLPGRMPCYYEPSRRRVSWKHNSAIAYAFSAEEPERLRGPQFMGAWADEFAIWPKPEHTLAMLRMGLRLGADPRLVLTTTPKPILSLRKLHAEASCAVTLAPTSANAKHLHEGFLGGLEEIYGGTKLAQQELMGELVAGDGALWTEEMIAGAKARWANQTAERVVVGVDPPASLSGVCGIVVAGRIGRTGVVLEDASAVGLSPNGWALRVKAAAERWGARKIIAEANQGGDMVRSTLAASGVGCAIQLVHASEGKRTRAEPVAALYEQMRVAHRGDFPALEEEMMALGAAEPEGRLDRADALVWALTALLVVKPPVQPRIIAL
jgi:phage terminase large subunit-like protein